MCDCCLATFYNKSRYNDHLSCNPSKYIQHEIMPTEPLIFKDCNKCVDLSDIVYADIEAILERCEATSTGKLRKHVPCCIGAYWVSKGEVLANGEEYHEFKGKECINSSVDYIDILSTFESYYERNKTQTRNIRYRQ